MFSEHPPRTRGADPHGFDGDVMKRTISRLAVFALLCAAAFVVSPAGTAQAAQNCPGSNYPASPGATVSVSTTTPRVGARIEVSGTGYCANEDVTITIAGKKVGTAHTDASGNFDPSVRVPGPPGTKTLTGAGASGLSDDSDSLTLDVQDGSAAGTGTGSNSGSGTAETGVQIAAIVAVAALLIGVGVAFASAGRRRKSAV